MTTKGEYQAYQDESGYFGEDMGDPLWGKFDRWVFENGQTYGQKSHRRKAWEAFRAAYRMGHQAASAEILGVKEAG